MLQLYHYPPSATSIRVRLCLHEKGLSVEERVVDLARLEHLRPAYRALNPDCVVPTLIHDGRVLTESSAIDEYLDGRPRLLSWLARIEERPAFDQVYAFLSTSQSGAETTTSDARPNERPGGLEHDQRSEERDHGRR